MLVRDAPKFQPAVTIKITLLVFWMKEKKGLIFELRKKMQQACNALNTGQVIKQFKQQSNSEKY